MPDVQEPLGRVDRRKAHLPRVLFSGSSSGELGVREADEGWRDEVLPEVMEAEADWLPTEQEG